MRKLKISEVSLHTVPPWVHQLASDRVRRLGKKLLLDITVSRDSSGFIPDQELLPWQDRSPELARPMTMSPQ